MKFILFAIILPFFVSNQLRACNLESYGIDGFVWQNVVSFTEPESAIIFGTTSKKSLQIVNDHFKEVEVDSFEGVAQMSLSCFPGTEAIQTYSNRSAFLSLITYIKDLDNELIQRRVIGVITKSCVWAIN